MKANGNKNIKKKAEPKSKYKKVMKIDMTFEEAMKKIAKAKPPKKK